MNVKNRDFKVILAANWDLAQAYDGNIEATVEAEYGAFVAKGNIVTLAHHTPEYEHHPAPANTDVIVSLPRGSTILGSHFDLDFFGGIMNITGNDIQDEGFRKAVDFIDVNGPHHLHKFPAQAPKINAYRFWEDNFRKKFGYLPTDKVVDFTAETIEAIEVINKILEGDQELIDAGEKYVDELHKSIESKLIEEDNYIRVFATDGVFCAGQYYSPNLQKITPFTVQFNTSNGSMTIGCADANGYNFNARNLVQQWWGKEAGGKAGVAGSPRGKRMTLNDLTRSVEFLRIYAQIAESKGIALQL